MSVDLAIARIRAFARSLGWSKTKLARAAGLHDTVLRNFDDPSWNPQVATLRTLESIIPASFAAAMVPGGSPAHTGNDAAASPESHGAAPGDSAPLPATSEAA